MNLFKIPTNLYELAAENPNFLRILNLYQCKKSIGKGGFGEVFLATDSKNNEYAIKEMIIEKLTPQVLNYFIREVYSMIQLQKLTPYTLPLIGFTVEKPLSIITKYMPKGSLSKYFRNDFQFTKFSGTQIQIIVIQILYGVQAMHRVGLIHRDLKLDNILLDKEMKPLIADFGLSRFQDSIMTRKVGTFTAMAPEVFYDKPYSFSADIYSLGMMFYRMSEGYKPVKNVTKSSLRNGIMYSINLPFSSKTPKKLKALILSCLNQEPTERPSIENLISQFISGEVLFSGASKKAVNDYFKENPSHEYIEPPLPEPMPNIDQFIDRLEKQYNVYKENRKVDPFNIDLFNQKIQSLTVQNFNEFYVDFVQRNLRDQNRCDSWLPIITQLSELMKKQKEYVHLFALNKYEQLLPELDQAIIPFAIEYVGFLFEYYPNEISQFICINILPKLINAKPFEMSVLFSYYFKNLSKVANPYKIIKVYLDRFQAFMNDEETSTYFLTVIYYFHINCPDLNLKCKNCIQKVVAQFCLNENSVKSGLRTFILIYSNADLKFINLTELLPILKGNDEASQLFMSLLLQINENEESEHFIKNKEFFDFLIDKAKDKSSKKASKILLRYSSTFQEYLCSDLTGNWLLHDLPTVLDTFRLFLCVATTIEICNQLCKTEGLINLLNRLKQNDKNNYFESVKMIITNSKMNDHVKEIISKM